ncbi:MAG: hypothetical protein ACMUIP_15515 [bacterium]
MQLFLSFLIGWVAGFWVFWDAKKRGRPDSKAFLWGLGTFFATIIFLPLWIFLRDKGPSGSSYRIVTDPTTHCSSCGGTFTTIPHAKYCPFCGQSLDKKINYPDITIDAGD